MLKVLVADDERDLAWQHHGQERAPMHAVRQPEAGHERLLDARKEARRCRPSGRAYTIPHRAFP